MRVVASIPSNERREAFEERVGSGFQLANGWKNLGCLTNETTTKLI
jgi:hypothetical protein